MATIPDHIQRFYLGLPWPKLEKITNSILRLIGLSMAAYCLAIMFSPQASNQAERRVDLFALERELGWIGSTIGEQPADTPQNSTGQKQHLVGQAAQSGPNKVESTSVHGNSSAKSPAVMFELSSIEKRTIKGQERTTIYALHTKSGASFVGIVSLSSSRSGFHLIEWRGIRRKEAQAFKKLPTKLVSWIPEGHQISAGYEVSVEKSE